MYRQGQSYCKCFVSTAVRCEHFLPGIWPQGVWSRPQGRPDPSTSWWSWVPVLPASWESRQCISRHAPLPLPWSLSSPPGRHSSWPWHRLVHPDLPHDLSPCRLWPRRPRLWLWLDQASRTPFFVLMTGSVSVVWPFFASCFLTRSTTLSCLLMLVPQLLGHTCRMCPSVSRLPHASHVVSCTLCHLAARAFVVMRFPWSASPVCTFHPSWVWCHSSTRLALHTAPWMPVLFRLPSDGVPPLSAW